MNYPDVRLFIDGEWLAAADGRSLAVHNPFDGREIGRVAHAGRADLDRALAAERGFATWRDHMLAARSTIMRAAAALLHERIDGIARMMTQEQGKPLAESRTEILAAAEIVEWFAEEGFRVYGRIVRTVRLRRSDRWCSRTQSVRSLHSRLGTSRSTKSYARMARDWRPAARRS